MQHEQEELLNRLVAAASSGSAEDIKSARDAAKLGGVPKKAIARVFAIGGCAAEEAAAAVTSKPPKTTAPVLQALPAPVTGCPTQTAIVEIPAPEHVVGVAPRLVAIGDSLTAGAPSMVSYTRALAEALESAGVAVEVTACGFCAATSAHVLENASRNEVWDLLGRRGQGLLHLIRERPGAWRRADVALIMVGTNDLGLTTSTPQLIFENIRRLHELCLEEGVRTVAMAIPDTGRAASFRLRALGVKPRRREVNGLLAAWARGNDSQKEADDLPLARPEFFVNPGRLLPHGPETDGAGLWEKDGVHFTAAGSGTLGTRLAVVLRPLVQRLRMERICLGRAVPKFRGGDGTASAGDEDDAGTPAPLETYLEAFDLEDEVQDVDESAAHPESPDWEVLPVMKIQDFYRRFQLKSMADALPDL